VHFHWSTSAAQLVRCSFPGIPVGGNRWCKTICRRLSGGVPRAWDRVRLQRWPEWSASTWSLSG